MFDHSEPAVRPPKVREIGAGPAPDPSPGDPADDLTGVPVGVPVGSRGWAAVLEASGESLGAVLGGPVGPAPVPGSARELIGVRLALGLMAPAGTEAEAIDRIRVLEQLKAACAAAQARQTHALETLRRTHEAARGVPADKRGRGLAAEIGLARGVSPHRGTGHLALARALAEDLAHTRAALTGGQISEDQAAVVHRETAWLARPADRARVDAAIAGPSGRARFLGVKQLAGQVRHLAIDQDPVAAAEHFDTAATERRLTLRATEHGMATLTATLPLVQAVACHQALADTAASAVALGEADGRTGAQVMADTLVQRLTGHATAGNLPIEVHLVMTDQALLGDDDGALDAPARVPGHGSLPASLARRLIADTDAEVFIRRLYTAPDTGQLVAMDSRRRTFPALLRRMVVFRDESCRTPYCDARIKHLDHATAHADGGQTSWANASGLCARCNYAKENPGWTHTAEPDHLQVTTPTGHRYDHPAPPLISTTPATTTPATTEPAGRPRIPGFTPLHLNLRQLTALLNAA